MDFLPAECLLHILKFVPGDCLQQCMLVSKKFNQIIKKNRNRLQKAMKYRLTFEKYMTQIEIYVQSYTGRESGVYLETPKKDQVSTYEVAYCEEDKPWMRQEKTIENMDLLTVLRDYLSRRLVRHDYESLVIKNVPPEECTVLLQLLDKHKMKIQQVDVCNALKSQMEVLFTNYTVKMAETLEITTSDDNCHMPDVLFQNLQFTRFSSLLDGERPVLLSFAQNIWIIKEWLDNRREIHYTVSYIPLVEHDIFHAELASLGFVNEDHTDSTIKILMKGNEMITLEWKMSGEHIRMHIST